MTVALFTHPACLLHDPGPGHPESPARLRAVLKALEAAEFAVLDRREAPLASVEQLGRVHRPGYVTQIIAAEPPMGGHVALDADTHMNHGSVEAAQRASGGAIAAVDAVMDGSARHAFVATRPPGHHAEAAKAMGFCLFNAVAVGALHARDRWGLTRIAVVDIDVHHGNGTQAMFWSDPALFYASSHQSPCYPGTGLVTDRGVAGNIVNRPLRPGSGSAAFRKDWEGILVELERFGPELVICSAGFDAHHADPLASLLLAEDDFGWAATRLAQASGGRLVSVLEGGYDLDALAASVAAYVRALLVEDAHAN
jgi:acetoin utilization deacetylase AcuC-like enzyme